MSVLLLVLSTGCSKNTSPKRLESERIKTEEIAYLLNGRPVSTQMITPSMSEIAGRRVVEEHALGSLLESELRTQGITLAPDAIASERSRLVDQLDPDASQRELIDRVRRARGLGPTRYDQLLRRNAILREIVRADPTYQSRVASRIAQSTQLAQSPRASIRICVFASSDKARVARETLMSGSPESLEWRFAALSASQSFDQSAPSGGLIRDLRVQDPNYPNPVRRAAESLSPGAVSEILDTPRGPTLVYLIQRSNPPTLDASQLNTIENRSTIATEQLMMEEAARRILDNALIIVTDPSLNWSQQGP